MKKLICCSLIAVFFVGCMRTIAVRTSPPLKKAPNDLVETIEGGILDAVLAGELKGACYRIEFRNDDVNCLPILVERNVVRIMLQLGPVLVWRFTNDEGVNEFGKRVAGYYSGKFATFLIQLPPFFHDSERLNCLAIVKEGGSQDPTWFFDAIENVLNKNVLNKNVRRGAVVGCRRRAGSDCHEPKVLVRH